MAHSSLLFRQEATHAQAEAAALAVGPFPSVGGWVGECVCGLLLLL